MAKLEYGFDPLFRMMDEDPWINLKTINEYLKDCEPIPPDLAAWLGQAITYSEGDATELLQRLGLKKRRGRQISKHSKDAWLTWGERIYVLEGNGEAVEAALDIAMGEYAERHAHGVDRTTLQRWRDIYREGRAAK